MDRVPSAPSRGVLRAEEVQTCKHMFVPYCGVDVVAKTCVKKSLLRRQQGGRTVVRKLVCTNATGFVTHPLQLKVMENILDKNDKRNFCAGSTRGNA